MRAKILLAVSLRKMSALDYRLPGQFEYRGILYSGGYKGIDINMLDKWKVQPSDVVIATYPKAGKAVVIFDFGIIHCP